MIRFLPSPILSLSCPVGLLCLCALLLVPHLFGVEEAQAQETGRHTVATGDSFSRIARVYGCAAGQAGALAVCRENFEASACATIEGGGSGPTIRPGMRLKIPQVCSGQPTTRRSGAKCSGCNWVEADLKSNKGLLKKAMKARGFKPPPKFRALVVKTVLKEGGTKVDYHQAFDYDGNGWDHAHWNPASTIKIYSAVAAMIRVKKLGFSEKAQVTFHDKRKDRKETLEDLFEKAAHISKNIPHNRLVQLAGFDFVNGKRGVLRKQAGLDFTHIMKGYELDNWRGQGHSASLRYSPKITLKEGKRRKVLPPQKGSEKTKCYSSACTSLSDLAKFLCTLMLHEQLPSSDRITDLDHSECKGQRYCPRQGAHLKWIRKKLNRTRTGRKDPVWDILAKSFQVSVGEKSKQATAPGDNQIFRKSGWARQWASDVLYIYQKGKPRWIVAMACHGNRYCLGRGKKSAAKILSDIFHEGGL